MQKILSFIKRYLGELLTIIGTGIFAYNAFNFYHTFDSIIAYYYPDDVLAAISISVMLIILGVIIMKRN